MPDLMSNAPCGFVSFADDGTIVEANQTLCSMLGYARVELLGWHVDRIFPPGGRIFYHTYLFPMLKVQALVEEVFVALRSKDGRDLPVLLNGARRERDGRFVSDCVCLRMIQRHQYEDQLLQARRLAEQSSEAKAKFLSMMSHDLRAPLTSIYGNALLLGAEQYGPLTAEQLRAVQTIRDACSVQMTLISDILDFATLESGRVEVQLQAVPVAGVLARAEALTRVQVDEGGLSLTIEGCGDGLAALADPQRLQQILLNLLTNAIKFTPPGGRIVIGCRAGGDRVRIEIRDTGVGISEEDLERIFSPFVQVDGQAEVQRATRGVGLGLAISRELARAMDGDVSAKSTPGQGSVFVVDLPAASPGGLPAARV
jgi:PAS domain S-box-containing protein